MTWFQKCLRSETMLVGSAIIAQIHNKCDVQQKHGSAATEEKIRRSRSVQQQATRTQHEQQNSTCLAPSPEPAFQPILHTSTRRQNSAKMKAEKASRLSACFPIQNIVIVIASVRTLARLWRDIPVTGPLGWPSYLTCVNKNPHATGKRHLWCAGRPAH